MLKAQSIVITGFLIAISQSANAENSWLNDLLDAAQNPISSLGNVALKFTFDEGAENGNGSILNVVPVIPVTIGDWKLVNRTIIPIAHVDGPIQGPNNPSPGQGGSADGLGDINYSLFFSPLKSREVEWGIGPSISLPTAGDAQLGSGKWSGGLTGYKIRPTDWGKMLLHGRQLWSFAGDSDRKNVNQTLLQPILVYTLNDDGWYLISDMLITANWKADNNNRWTVPIGGGFGNVFKFGNQALNSRFEAYHYAVRSDGGPKNSVNITFQFLFPK